jgi:hypothetical protein
MKQKRSKARKEEEKAQEFIDGLYAKVLTNSEDDDPQKPSES